MIIDKLENAEFYYNMGSNFQKAFEFLKNTDLENLEVGRYEIDKDKMYVNIDKYNTKPEQDGKFEAHKNYIDIQYIISGEEKMGYTDIENCENLTEYDDQKDIIFLKNKESKNHFAYAKKGIFVVFAPQDAHMPCISIENSTAIKKAVVKIKIN